MDEAAEPGRKLKLAAIAPQDAGREGAEVEDECKQGGQKSEGVVQTAESWTPAKRA